MSRNKGKDFEDQWRDSYKKTPYLFIRLQDSNKWTSGTQTRFTPKSPYDGIQYAMPFVFLLELKSTGGTSFSFNPNKPYEKLGEKKTFAIQPHQVRHLMEEAQKEGVIPGFILNFRPRTLKNKTTENATYFVHINDFLEFAKQSNKSSINKEDCKLIGLRIDQKLKRIKYNYNIEKFVRDTVQMCFEKGHLHQEAITKLKGWVEEFDTYGGSTTRE